MKCNGSDALATPNDLKSKIQRSIGAGYELYVQDIASAIGTDVLLANTTADEREELVGYLTVRAAGDDGRPSPLWTVIFYSGDEPPLIRYRIRVPMERGQQPSLEKVTPPKPAGTASVLIRARKAALKAAGPFTQRVNPAVLPGDAFGDSGDILVELLAGTHKPNTVVLGKHTRVLVSEDGTQVKSVTPLSNIELELITANDGGGEGDKLAGLYVNQIVTDYPVETHVFASLSSKVPLYVSTSRGTWLVNGKSICLISGPTKAGNPK